MTQEENTSESQEVLAQAALAAYLAMKDSKQEYFTLLQTIEANKGGTPEETEELAALLAIHDKKVHDYQSAMQTITDIEVRNNLIKKMM